MCLVNLGHNKFNKNLGRLIKGEEGPRSCTPAGVMALLEKNQPLEDAALLGP